MSRQVWVVEAMHHAVFGGRWYPVAMKTNEPDADDEARKARAIFRDAKWRVVEYVPKEESDG